MNCYVMGLIFNNRQVSIEEGDNKAREFGALFMETSAKVGFNIKVNKTKTHKSMRYKPSP